MENLQKAVRHHDFYQKKQGPNRHGTAKSRPAYRDHHAGHFYASLQGFPYTFELPLTGAIDARLRAGTYLMAGIKGVCEWEETKKEPSYIPTRGLTSSVPSRRGGKVRAAA